MHQDSATRAEFFALTGVRPTSPFLKGI